MSAVPKKKLCWNCEGNVPKDVDNCPYCAVYLHGADEDQGSSWMPSQHENEEIPPPPYQSLEEHPQEEAQTETSALHYNDLKLDVLPALFLMAGSVFFLFGIVLSLFSENGALTLQWKSYLAPYFLVLSAPLIFMGWKYLQTMEDS